MYVPSSYAQKDLTVLHDFIEKHGFATLVSHGQSGETQSAPIATHLPLLIDRNAGNQGELLGHVARANPQAKLSEGTQVLAIFQGPHAYISPRWYQVADAVPTWNYLAVHVYGTLKKVDEAQQLRDLETTVNAYEASQENPWSVAEASHEYIQKLAAAILSFRIEIQRIEGAWKLNQHHEPERRKRTIEALLAHGGADQVAIATLMAQTQKP